MRSKWTSRDADAAVQQYGRDYGDDVALRLYSARLVGRESTLVLHGGGNVSVKSVFRTPLGEAVDAIFVKASGGDLAYLEPPHLPPLDLTQLCKLRRLSLLDERLMVNEVRRALFDVSAPTPSIETLMHAFLPHRFVDHSHADAVLALTNQAQGDALVRRAVDQPIAILPYVKPGFDLSKAVADLYDREPHVEGIVLMFHGLVTFGEDAKTSYERHVAIVDACERFIAHELTSRRVQIPVPYHNDLTETAHRSASVAAAVVTGPASRAAAIAPSLRGLLARANASNAGATHGPMLEWRCNDALLALLSHTDTARLAGIGPLTADHLIHTRPWYVHVDLKPGASEDLAASTLEESIARFQQRYAAYVQAHGGDPTCLHSAPRVVLIPDVGLFAWGTTKARAAVIADIAEHTLVTRLQAESIGSYAALCERDLYAMEYYALEQAKIAPPSTRPLENQVVLITGAAGAIGSAVAEVCAEAGAYVAVTDIDGAGAQQVAEEVRRKVGGECAIGLPMDVTDESGVRAAFESAARHFGGVDVVVPNAGAAHVAELERLDADDFARLIAINAGGYLNVIREGARVLKRQRLGGNIVIISTKNVFAPGAGFGAYSASKAAGHQLGRVAALELAPHGIRVNMINPDAVFGDADRPSGLWQAVAPSRAKSKGIDESDLPEHYRRRNLLKVRVTGRDVGRAVVFFASNATPTTGATLPVDGGLSDAFPR